MKCFPWAPELLLELLKLKKQNWMVYKEYNFCINNTFCYYCAFSARESWCKQAKSTAEVKKMNFLKTLSHQSIR